MKAPVLAVLLLAALAAMPAAAASPDGHGVIVTVNDLPITDFDIDQRIKLWAAIGREIKASNLRKAALESLIDDMIKQAAAKKYNALASEDMVDKQVARMAGGSDSDVTNLAAKLKAKGVSMSALRSLVRAQISFNRLLSALYKVKVEIDPSEVDKKLQELANDPRLKPVTVYEILEITLPIEKTSEAMMQQLMLARVADAQMLRRNYKGCASARKAATGIYNVRIGSLLKADGRKLPAPLKNALDKSGPGALLGPARSPGGIQFIAYCGKTHMAPPAPTRQQVENMLMNKKYDTYEERYMRELRRTAFVDYKDQSFAQ